jgi:hypothetical protein
MVTLERQRIAFETGRLGRAILSALTLLNRVGSHRHITVFGLGVAVILLRLALLHSIPIPHPWVADEFSYLLGADTFASGRLTNPTPHLWRAFEGVHIIVQPTYASKYPPGQAAFLAMGQVVFGHPYWGVVLGMALFCAATCWMLQALVSPGWALIGGVLTFTTFGINHYWMESYWGGAVAAFGGCLVTGSAFRMLRKIRPERYAWPLCAGVAIMFFTRPFEGCVLTFVVVLILTVGLWRQRDQIHLRRLLLPCLIAGSGVIAFQAYYDWRVTGSPVTLPYAVHEKTYAPVPTFWFSPMRTDVPHPSDRVLYATHWNWEMEGYEEIQHLARWRRPVNTVDREFQIFLILFGVFGNVLWLIPVFWSDLRVRLLTAMAVSGLLADSMIVWAHVHYLAPVIPAILALIVVIIQKLRSLATPSGTRVGTLIAGLTLVLMIGYGLERRPIQHLVGSGFRILGDGGAALVPEELAREAKDRDDLIANLSRSGRKHLIIVLYSPTHRSVPDWVHNGANLDEQRVIWASDQGPEENRALISYYHDRQVWLLRSSNTAHTISPYNEQVASSITSDAKK